MQSIRGLFWKTAQSSEIIVAHADLLAPAMSLAMNNNFVIADPVLSSVDNAVEPLLPTSAIAKEMPAHTQAELNLAGSTRGHTRGHQVARDGGHGVPGLRQQRK